MDLDDVLGINDLDIDNLENKRKVLEIIFKEYDQQRYLDLLSKPLESRIEEEIFKLSNYSKIYETHINVIKVYDFLGLQKQFLEKEIALSFKEIS